MASKKLKQQIRSSHHRAPMREVVDAYAEGILDGVEAERRRQRDSLRHPFDRGSSMHRQVTDNGKTLESLLEAPPK